MNRLTPRALVLWVACGIALFLAVLLILRTTCSPSTDPNPTVEDCSNGVDDDDDGQSDCDDLDGLDQPRCRSRSPLRERPPHADAPQIGPATRDGGDVDGRDADGGAIRPYCTHDSGVCVWECEEDSDCTIALDTMSCCGGHRHEVDGVENVTCPTAVHRARLDEDPCVFPALRGLISPIPPRMCRPICDGLVCGACRTLSRAICRDSECVGIPEGRCVRDDECPEGLSCVSLFEAGSGVCRAGSHECTTDDECRASFPDCESCNCLDSDIDGFRDCSCMDCADGRCTIDSQCAPHEFCIDRQCQFAGEDACRLALWDCPRGHTCEASEDNPSRGRCLRPTPPQNTDPGELDNDQR